MSSILFGYTMSLTTAATPSTGFLVAYDIDGILKQKDSAGVITPIGGSGSGGGSFSVVSGTPSLDKVLQVSNDSATYSILMGTATSIIMGSASYITSQNGLSNFYLDYNSATSSVYLTNGYNYLSIDNSYIKLIGATLSSRVDINNGSNYLKFGTISELYSLNEIRLRVSNTSDEILLKSNIGLSVSSANSISNAVFIGSQNSTFDANIVNSVIIGGSGQYATQNDSVYIPDTYIQNTKKLRGTLGNSSLSFTDTNDLILENSSSLLALISSSSSTPLITNGLIVSDTTSAFTSPNIDSSVTFISTKNSTIGQGVHNSVIIGGENLVASATNSVVLGQYVNINNQYTLPIADGASGSYIRTDGLGNLYWQTTSAEVQNLEDVLTLGNWTGNNSIEMGTGSVLYSANGGGQINLDYTGPGVVAISTDGGNFNQAYIELANDDIMIVNNLSFSMGIGSASIVVSDGRGLVYAFDYSSTFVTYSLVDKNYVDLGTASIWTSINSMNNDYVSEVIGSNGLTGGGTSGTVTVLLGGTLSQNTTIDGNSFDLSLSNIGQLISTASYILSETGGGYVGDLSSNYNRFVIQSSGIDIISDYLGTTSQIHVNENFNEMVSSGGGSSSSIRITNLSSYVSNDGSLNSMIVLDEISQKGLVYYDDYSSNFTTYSLVTKGYVDTIVSSSATNATNGLSEISSGLIGIGGTLSQNTNIQGDGKRFTIRDTANMILSASGSGYSAEIGYVDGLEFNIFYGDEDSATLWSWDGTNTVQISACTSDNLVSDGSTNNRLVVSDGVYNKGLVYSSDYTANFTTHSLVTKGWVSSNTTNKYSVTQGFTASVTETITHNLGTDEVIVQCYDSSGIMVIPGTIQINGTNAVDITFSQTLSTIKTVIIG